MNKKNLGIPALLVVLLIGVVIAIIIAPVSVAQAKGLGGEPGKPSILVIYPNGDETWPVGGTYTIIWTYHGLLTPPMQTTYIYIIGPEGRVYIGQAPTSQKEYSWTVPGTQATGQYSIELYTKIVEDFSDSNFSIVSPPPVEEIIRVNGGDQG